MFKLIEKILKKNFLNILIIFLLSILIIFNNYINYNKELLDVKYNDNIEVKNNDNIEVKNKSFSCINYDNNIVKGEYITGLYGNYDNEEKNIKSLFVKCREYDSGDLLNDNNTYKINFRYVNNQNPIKKINIGDVKYNDKINLFPIITNNINDNNINDNSILSSIKIEKNKNNNINILSGIEFNFTDNINNNDKKYINCFNSKLKNKDIDYISCKRKCLDKSKNS